MAVLVKKEWEKHISKVTRFNYYVMLVVLTFKNKSIHIFQVYVPPNDEKSKVEINNIINKHISKSNKTYTVIMGDFNMLHTPLLDTNNLNTQKYRREDRLITTLRINGLYDSFRLLYPDTIDYTWSQNESSSRIDYIWISDNWSHLIWKA